MTRILIWSTAVGSFFYNIPRFLEYYTENKTVQYQSKQNIVVFHEKYAGFSLDSSTEESQYNVTEWGLEISEFRQVRLECFIEFQIVFMIRTPCTS